MPKLNNLEYHLLSDGVMWVDGGSTFGMVPRIIWAEIFPPDAQNRLPFALNSMLIRSEGKTILVDTGLGTRLDEKTRQRVRLERPEGGLFEALSRLGVTVEEIDLVVNTHLHSDHCSGNTIRRGDRLVPAFPNAQYLVQRLEWADAIAPNERTRATYLPENYRPLEESGHLKLIDGPTRITGEVRTEVTRGNTRAYQVVILESGEETAVFVADMVSLHYHLERLAWVPAYDLEPMEAIETKRYWQQWMVERDALIIFQHDTQIPFGRLRPDGANFRVEPILID
ncbi:MAG: MBL fold metallo-hydrolase [Chloroflexi bacterium]|nr:MBL fold metallo-hydrolase [Chloroflexota bacterium]